jgi:hypothetical protein
MLLIRIHIPDDSIPVHPAREVCKGIPDFFYGGIDMDRLFDDHKISTLFLIIC